MLASSKQNQTKTLEMEGCFRPRRTNACVGALETEVCFRPRCTNSVVGAMLASSKQNQTKSLETEVCFCPRPRRTNNVVGMRGSGETQDQNQINRRELLTPRRW
jgi:hypothetical protein